MKCADLAANPYLLLAGLLLAGLDGVHRGLLLPPEVTGDLAALGGDELARQGIRRLPATTDEAMDEFARRPGLREALGPVLADAVVAVRRGEARRMAGADPDAVAAAYRWVY